MNPELIHLLQSDGLTEAVQFPVLRAVDLGVAGRVYDAIRIADAARGLARASQDETGEGVATLLLGLMFLQISHRVAAANALARAIQLFRRSPSWPQPWNEAVACLGLAAVWRQEYAASPAKSCLALQRALDLFREAETECMVRGRPRQLATAHVMVEDLVEQLGAIWLAAGAAPEEGGGPVGADGYRIGNAFPHYCRGFECGLPQAETALLDPPLALTAPVSSDGPPEAGPEGVPGAVYRCPDGMVGQPFARSGCGSVRFHDAEPSARSPGRCATEEG
jgi:hypothetical protein